MTPAAAKKVGYHSTTSSGYTTGNTYIMAVNFPQEEERILAQWTVRPSEPHFAHSQAAMTNT